MALPNPVGKQREVLALDAQGHFVVLGTAGSGKTTLAILRASMLSQSACSGDERVLLVTFNKALVTYLQEISTDELENVDVRNYHKFAIGYLSSRGAIGWRDIVDRSPKIELIESALETIRKNDSNPLYNKSAIVFSEEINWIQRMGFKDIGEYTNAARVGRAGTRIKRSDRQYYFKVYQEYLNLRISKGFKYDWDDIAYYVWQELLTDDTHRKYRHVIIDEGQDFSPTMIKSLVATVPNNGSISFFGDVAQQIYGSRLSWRSAGLNPTRVWNFKENYRNTKEIAELGLAITTLPFYKDVPDIVKPNAPKASGPKPALVNFRSVADELNTVLATAIDQSKTQTVAILVRNRNTVKSIKKRLRVKGVSIQELHGDMNLWNSDPGVSVGTFHSSKGLEFDVVLMPFCDNNTLPDNERIVALEGEEEALTEEARLIYVGVTRAKQWLMISYTGELTQVLPRDNTLYRVVSR